MKRSVIYFLSGIVFIAGCGSGPSAKDQSLLSLREKLEARHERQFSYTDDVIAGKSVQGYVKEEATHRASDDPKAYVYNEKMLSYEEEKEWVEAGISNDEYPLYAELGMGAQEVLEWKKVGVSYAAIALFKKEGYSPDRTTKFLQKSFLVRPRFYHQFGTPVYEFDTICKNVIKKQEPAYAFLEERCLPYMEASHKNEAIGHLLDDAGVKKGPLALEYLAELRALKKKRDTIQSGMEVVIEEFIDDEDTKNFSFLFPLLINEPTDYEMEFIDKNRLALTDTDRFHSYKNKEYWDHRRAVLKAEEEEAERQEQLLRAKKENERKAAEAQLQRAQKAAAQKALEEKMFKERKVREKRENALSEKARQVCGDLIAPDQLSGQPVYIDGTVLFTVGEGGDRMYGYGVESRGDKMIYFIRDPQNLAQSKVGQSARWKLKTMGRTEALEKISAQEYGYNKKSKTKYTMALFMESCQIK